MSGSLDLMARLARQEVDSQRRKLAADEARLMRLLGTRNAVHTANREALEIAATGEQLPFWAGIIEGGRRQSIAIAQRIDNQQSLVGATRDGLIDRYLELKRLDILALKRAQATRLRAQGQEQAERDERLANHPARSSKQVRTARSRRIV